MTIRIDGTNTTGNPGITGGDADTGLQFGTDEVKIVTGGSERALVDSSGYLRLAGGGLQFNGDTAAANALDDYEEGTWTPVISVNGFSQSVSNTSGTYTKVGNIINVVATVTLSSSGRPTSYVQMDLPITNTFPAVGVFSGSNPGAGIQGGSVLVSGSNVVIWYPTNGATDSTGWYCTFTYRT